MSRRYLVRATSVLAAALIALPASAQSTEPHVQLVVRAGRSLRIALDRTVRVRSVGQQVTGMLVEPVYVYDRIVLPAGIRAIGVGAIEGLPRGARVRTILAGDFTSPRPGRAPVRRSDLERWREADFRLANRRSPGRTDEPVAEIVQKTRNQIWRPQCRPVGTRSSRGSANSTGFVEQPEVLRLRRNPRLLIPGFDRSNPTTAPPTPRESARAIIGPRPPTISTDVWMNSTLNWPVPAPGGYDHRSGRGTLQPPVGLPEGSANRPLHHWRDLQRHRHVPLARTATGRRVTA